jgi:methyl-accepting chemotaxis protein
MEMMTQQSAAMVEETSGAARNLQQDSSRLTGLVQRFSASRGSQRAATPPPKISPPVARAAPVVGNLALQSDDDWGEF